MCSKYDNLWVTFMFKSQYLTYDIEKLNKWHVAVVQIITLIAQSQKYKIVFIERVTGCLNHLTVLVVYAPDRINLDYAPDRSNC